MASSHGYRDGFPVSTAGFALAGIDPISKGVYSGKPFIWMKSTDTPPARVVHIFKTHFERIATPVCYDLDFPYFRKIASLDGASIIINPSLIRNTLHGMWQLYVAARSLENRLNVASTNSISNPFN